ncbi:DNA-directed RNA polymerase subunit beta [Agromyces atrinae]|uniref:DNA-directed RNA polymerase subunit beta n=1 Tax=Agromyces atrinae TaxID=592376 RepID=UPI001F56A5BD|nr:DNA-directed RNA polymerase subunit beta [Agromyces atrinae]MCI2957940.1 DNA-directed RNA polymerase subunit beta [Agromyces atrinae]
MAADFHKPTRFTPSRFDGYFGGEDPAILSRTAHDTASALLSRVRDDPDPEVIERLVAYTDANGIDAIAELWSHSSARSLPGALWRIYLLRTLIRQDPDGTSYYYSRGAEVSTTIDTVVAGAATPVGAAEVVDVADRILRGLFAGDFAVALDRAAAFARVTAIGMTEVADAADATDDIRAGELTRRALRLSELAAELTSCARLWRTDSLD